MWYGGMAYSGRVTLKCEKLCPVLQQQMLLWKVATIISVFSWGRQIRKV